MRENGEEISQVWAWNDLSQGHWSPQDVLLTSERGPGLSLLRHARYCIHKKRKFLN